MQCLRTTVFLPNPGCSQSLGSWPKDLGWSSNTIGPLETRLLKLVMNHGVQYLMCVVGLKQS